MFHEQYYADGDLVLFQCTECDYTSMSVGALHAHVEKHRGYTRLGIQIPFTKTSPGNFGELMGYTSVRAVDGTTEISISDVDGL